jgi:Kef-type K+ transport system membrane component KefB/mannitol/fructose-specific phosphotransferase system IIA component (Ntr-type)
MTELMTRLVIQLGIIIFAARYCGLLMKKINMPSVLGELLAGILIGPFLLGAFPIPGFPEGIFPLPAQEVAVTPELYGIATIASVILLFMSGLETDLSLFLRYSVAGLLVGIGGVIASFFLGVGSAMIFLGRGFSDPGTLFLGILSTATSVGITARILSDQKKMDSPEGATILAAAVIDDVLGIICLAVVLGLVAVLKTGGNEGVNVLSIIEITGKALGVWLGFTALGLVLSKSISRFLKTFKNITTFSVLSLGLAFLLAGIFEKAGLAMIIGAYVMGLSLSKTDIAYVIQEKVHTLYEFFVPIFFVVMGMMVNVRELASAEVLVFGAVYTILAVAAKVLGCGIPALFLNFNPLGALRIGIGMVPRGEVALIIAGIGIAGGFLNQQLFGVAILMTLLTTIIPPPILTLALKKGGRGTKKEVKGSETVQTSYTLPSAEIAEVIEAKVAHGFEKEGFFVYRMELDQAVYQMRKNDISFSLSVDDQTLRFESSPQDVALIKTEIYESLVSIHDAIEKMKESNKPEEMAKTLSEDSGRVEGDIFKSLDPKCIITNLRGKTKDAVITELVELLDANGKLLDKAEVLKAVFEREKSMSTGMQYGVALPHGKTDAVERLTVAAGLKPEGIDFDSIDGEPSTIFFLVLSPKKTTGPHVQFLAAVSSILNSEDARSLILGCTSAAELYEYLKFKAGK